MAVRLKRVLARRTNRKLRGILGALAASCLLTPALALEDSVGEAGINARRLHAPPYSLTGRKIAIGQVEIGRPAKFGLDKAYVWNPAIDIAGLFIRDRPAKANARVDSHAAMVAMVMVSQDKQLSGVAPGARLYAAAIGSLRFSGQPQECLSSQHVALQNGGDVRAINYSFGESLDRDPRENASLDGNALLTQCVDWSARVHNVLYAIAGNQGSGGIPIPTDHYNGISTAYTTKREGQFNKVDFANLSDLPVGIGRRLIAREINTGKRRAISLVAPGSKIKVFNLEGEVTKVSGTSFAAPHLTASVALLQEYGDRQLVSKRIDWSRNSRQHEVMKAVLINAADKVTGALGMERTILTKDNQTWLESDAFQNEEIPVDIQMGAGQLNVYRAYQQLSAGQWGYKSPVPAVGWNYSKVQAQTYQDYVLDQPLEAGSFAAMTLAWDRRVELLDENRNDRYDIGEEFRDFGLNNLDLYLLPASSNDLEDRVCSSTSLEDSLEHIFCQVPRTGQYKVRVQYHQQVHEIVQPYALAWWTD